MVRWLIQLLAVSILGGWLLAEAFGAPPLGNYGHRRGPWRKLQSSPDGVSVGTNARDWQHRYNGTGCQAAPHDLNDQVGSVNLTQSALTSYTCGQSTSGLDPASIGIDTDSGILFTEACWNSGATSFPAVPDGENFLVRLHMQHGNQTASNFFFVNQAAAADYWWFFVNSSEAPTFRIDDAAIAATSANGAALVVGTEYMIDLHYDAGNEEITLSINGVHVVTSITGSPAAWAARQLALGSNQNCTNTQAMDAVVVYSLSVSYCADGGTCAAGEWTQSTHDADCAADVVGCL